MTWVPSLVLTTHMKTEGNREAKRPVTGHRATEEEGRMQNHCPDPLEFVRPQPHSSRKPSTHTWHHSSLSPRLSVIITRAGSSGGLPLRPEALAHLIVFPNPVQGYVDGEGRGIVVGHQRRLLIRLIADNKG